MLTQQYFNECFRYEKESGVLIWRRRPRSHFRTDRGWKTFNRQKLGLRACRLGSDGYLRVRVDGLNLKAHRVIFKMVFGNVPEQIDHINGCKSDNRLVNLRSANKSINMKNARKRCDNSSGIMGVDYDNRRSAWRVRIYNNTTCKHLGYFEDKFNAICARKSAENKYGYHVNHGRLK